MQIFIYCKATLHVSGVTVPIIRSTKTVTGTGHNTGAATSLQRGLIGPIGFAVNKYLHTVASGWIFIHIELRCMER